MKKTMLILFSIIFLNCIFLIKVNAQENALNLMIGAEGQFSQQNLELIQQKINDLSSKLNLTDEHKQKAEELGIYSDEKLNIYRVKFIKEKNKLITLKKSSAPLIQIQTQVRLVKSAKARLNIARKKNILEFEAMLTPEQQTYFDQFKVDLQGIKEKEIRVDREQYEVQSRDDALKNIEDFN